MNEKRIVLELKQISQAYGSQLVVKDLSLTLAHGEIGCLLGASGCGKTTVLRTIAGFEPLLDGEIILNGERVSRNGYQLPPAKRQMKWFNGCGCCTNCHLGAPSRSPSPSVS